MVGMGVKYDAVQLKEFGGGCAPISEDRSQLWWLCKQEPTKPIDYLLQVDPAVRCALEAPSRPDDVVPSHRQSVIVIPKWRRVPQHVRHVVLVALLFDPDVQ